MGYFKELDIDRQDLMFNIHDRIALEESRGFDSVDEMKEVFLEIANDFNISVDLVWEVYYDSDYERVSDYDIGDLHDEEY